MNKLSTRLLSLLVVLTMLLGMVGTAGAETASDVKLEYTYRTYLASLGQKWNPHTIQLIPEDTVCNDYLSTSLVDISILDSENSIYQWIWEGAESIVDVTAEHQDDIVTFKASVAENTTAQDWTDGYVFEIKLNPAMKWQDGTPINVDTYLYSMQQLLNPTMHNIMAARYYDGDYALAGAKEYYNSGSPIYAPVDPETFDLAAGIANGTAYVSPTANIPALPLEGSMSSLVANYKLPVENEFNALREATNPYGYVKVTEDILDELVTVFSTCVSGFGIKWDEMDEAAQNKLLMSIVCYNNGEVSELMPFEQVGLYKVDEYTMRWVSAIHTDYNGLLNFFVDSWLVYEPLYEAGKDTTGALVTTNYGTAVENTMSCGPYKLVSMQAGKQMVFEKNENYYRYTKNEDGRLVAVTDFEVDGEYVPMYETDRIVIDVMDADSAKQAFLKGELSEWFPSSSDLPNYSTSDKLYKAPAPTTFSLFFACSLENLKAMDATKGNTNSVVLSNLNFRKAFSLGIDRTEYVTATAGYVPAYAMLNTTYYYNIFEDAGSSYRASTPAKQGVVDLYGVEYGEGKIYPDLDTAYKSINGYNLTEAQRLMKLACEELVADGLYTAGEDIVIRVARATGALTSDINQQMTLLNKYINAAAEGSGFGKITLDPVGNVTNLYVDVAGGEYAIGYGGWGGFNFEPFRNFIVYFDNTRLTIHEGGSWNPSATDLTLTVEGEEVTMTWAQWSNSMMGNGPYATADTNTKLQIMADLEKTFLSMYYRIPLCSNTECYLLSYQCNEYTDQHNVLYQFGGVPLRTFDYTDAEWEEFVNSQGGSLSYE